MCICTYTYVCVYIGGRSSYISCWQSAMHFILITYMFYEENILKANLKVFINDVLSFVNSNSDY